jgi:hypothetical protein
MHVTHALTAQTHSCDAIICGASASRLVLAAKIMYHIVVMHIKAKFSPLHTMGY